MDDIARQIAALESRLVALDRERSEIVERLCVLKPVQAEAATKAPFGIAHA